MIGGVRQRGICWCEIHAFLLAQEMLTQSAIGPMDQFVRQMLAKLRLAQARAQMIGGLQVAVAEQDQAQRLQTVEAVCASTR